jgi:hypothetical protein
VVLGLGTGEDTLNLLASSTGSLAGVLAREGAGTFEGVVAIRGEGVGGEEAVLALALEVVLLEVFEEVVQTAIVLLLGLFLAGLPVHNDYNLQLFNHTLTDCVRSLKVML